MPSFERGMDPVERELREKISERLKREGKMKSYAALQHFKLFLEDIDDEETGQPLIGATRFNDDGSETMEIIINRYLTLDSMYVVVRHELLHNILSHMLKEMELLKHMKLVNEDGTPFMIKKPGSLTMEGAVRLVDIIHDAMNIAEDIDLTRYMDDEERAISDKNRTGIKFLRKPTEAEKEAAENALKWANYLVKEGDAGIAYTTGGYVWDDPEWKHVEHMQISQILQEVLKKVEFVVQGGKVTSNPPGGPKPPQPPQPQQPQEPEREVEVIFGKYIGPQTFIDENGNEAPLVEW